MKPMSRMLILLKRLIMTSAFAMAVIGVAAAPSSASTGATTPPPFVRDALSGAALAGEGQMRFLGLRIYDARLWVGERFDAADFGLYPLALELTYHRRFTGAAIAQRTIEEIKRQGKVASGKAEEWQKALVSIFPDIQPGDRLTGLYEPGKGMRLWRASQSVGAIDDPELARRFFGIWLSSRTSEPGLRSALLSRKPGSGS